MMNFNGLAETFNKTGKLAKDSFYRYLGMLKGGGSKRNVLGASLVILPEVPAYFIPSFTQAKATGNAHDVKKGEGPRGLLTGALEGLAVGAIVAEKQIKFKGVLPFVLVGASLQFISSKIFPIFGEKFGQILYNNKKFKLGSVQNECSQPKLDVVSESPANGNKPSVAPSFNQNTNLLNIKSMNNSSNMKI